MTLIHNLETFGIEPEAFGHTIQKGVACSTSLSQLPGKGKGMEVMVQGNQVNYIAQLLLGEFLKGVLDPYCNCKMVKPFISAYFI